MPTGHRQHHRLVKEILFAALEHEGPERALYLETACRGDDSLRSEVLSLLTQYERDGGFLDGVASWSEVEFVPRPALPATLPERVGSYEVLELIGWGAMGVVYRARQESPSRDVALKVLRRNCVDDFARRRFEREARALGLLQHPGIARIYEAGFDEKDIGRQPFLALELIEGDSIGEYARRAGLDWRGRVELFLQVCDAVDYAHGRGVLHRDLKPENILVDSHGATRVLDFSVARLAADRGDFKTLTGHLLGTLAYMSPEQARGAELDERSDQFSLGVVLYELLVGRLPFGERTLEDLASIDSAVAEPLRSIVPELPADLETVVHKAMEADPARRYESVGALGHDLRRLLRGRPILARRPTAMYRIRKLVGRHRAVAAGFATAVVALAAGLVVALHGWKEARAAEDGLRRERAAVLRLSDRDRLDELRSEARELWPIAPEPMDAWLARAEDLRSSVPEHRRALEAFRQAALSQVDSADESSERRGRMWTLELQRALVADLEDFFREGDDPGLFGRIQERRRESSEVARRTLEEPADRWGRALAGIGDPRHPLYGRLVIEPQVGLVPLGPDPRSGLWEFALHGRAGEVPDRDPASGELGFDERSSIVLVLVPGGKSWIGAQAGDPEGVHYDPKAFDHEGPPREVDLAPFFLSKYEMTQAQWFRIEGTRPSYWSTGDSIGEYRFNDLHPVEHVDHEQARRVLAKLGCGLPTEAQWEAAARAGTTTPWWTGEDPTSLCGAVYFDSRGICEWEDPAVPFRGLRVPAHAPVGSFPPNPFGFHDILGNVMEWCLDDYKVAYYELGLRDGDGLVLTDGGRERSYRGGSHTMRPGAVRAAKRFDAIEIHREAIIGLRPARAVVGPWSREGGD